MQTIPSKASQDELTIAGKAVEALGALVLLAPFAGQKALGLQPAQHRIEGALVDLQARVRQHLAQGVAVALDRQGREHGQDQAAAPQLEAELLVEVVFDGHVGATGWHMVYDIHCMLVLERILQQ